MTCISQGQDSGHSSNREVGEGMTFLAMYEMKLRVRGRRSVRDDKCVGLDLAAIVKKIPDAFLNPLQF